MRGGDIGRVPARALAFHIDCVLVEESKQKIVTWMAERLRPVIGSHWMKKTRRGARTWSHVTFQESDYSIIVVVTDPSLLRDDPRDIRNRLEDDFGFICSRVLCCDEAGLRQFLTDDDYVEIYFDSEEDRAARISIRTRVFTGWSQVGH